MKSKLQESIPDFIMVGTATLWFISIIVAMIDRTYAIPLSLQSAMAIIVGSLYGNKLLRKGSNGKDDSNSDGSV